MIAACRTFNVAVGLAFHDDDFYNLSYGNGRLRICIVVRKITAAVVVPHAVVSLNLPGNEI